MTAVPYAAVFAPPPDAPDRVVAQSHPPADNGTPTARLTCALSAGSEEAFREFYARFSDRLFRYHLVLARGDEQLARDGVQETFVRVATKPRRFDDEQALWNWIAKIARNVAVDAHRRRLSYWKLLTRYTDDVDHPRAAPPVDGDSLLHDLLERSLALLEPADRALIQHKYFDRIPVRELARECDLSEKCIDSRLVRARRALREMIVRQLRDETF